MAAVGILAALRERDRSGEGQLVDVSMADGALVVAGDGRRRATSPTASCRAAATLELAGALVCYRPVCVRATAGSRSGRWSRSSGRSGVAASGREDLIEKQFERPGSDDARGGRGASSSSARASSGRRSRPSTTAAWSRCSTSTRRSSPTSCARARWSSSSTSRAPRRRCASSASPIKLVAHAGEHRGARAGAGRAHRRGARARPATPTRRSPCCEEAGAVAGPAAGVQRIVHGMSARDARRPDEDVRAGRAVGGQRRHDQALPARGPAARAGRARRATWPSTRRSSSSGSG